MNTNSYTMNLSHIGLSDLSRVGGKNASLGELRRALLPLGVNVPDGFATTADAYYRLLQENELEEKLRAILSDFDLNDNAELQRRGQQARSAILDTKLPDELCDAFLSSYDDLCKRLGREPELAVRSSATAEDLPEASFAGAAETFLNVRGKTELLKAIHNCFASLFTDRAISYRASLGYGNSKIALSVGVQPMVRSDLACSGVIFTLDTESGFRNAIEITGSYGLGEYVVQGIVTPDEWTVFKPTLLSGFPALIDRRLGSKDVKLVYAGGTKATAGVFVSETDRYKFCLSDDEVLQLGRWACLIEDHYSKLAGHPQPMDIEWAKDGITGELFIVQARPETVHSNKDKPLSIETYKLKEKPGDVLLTGQAVGERIGAGRVRIVNNVNDLSKVEEGDVLVSPSTNPDWEPVMKRVSAIVTDHGGRTAHAAIVSRELGIPCVVGARSASALLQNVAEVTVSCAEGSVGKIYAGKLEFEIAHEDLSQLPQTNTKIFLNVADPAQAFTLSALPVDGVGLARMEFIINNHIGIHPLAVANFSELKDQDIRREIMTAIYAHGFADPKEFFISRLADGIGRIAAAFYPRPVVVRTSDFKTNEYSKLIGGAEFEPREENPMLGWRGASRYYDERYRDGFALECAALKRVRDEKGLGNVKIMIPFCRTPDEGKKVIAEMASNGLSQGENGLEIYAMCELPSNIVEAESFLKIFDGFSIGSNDLTQLVLGVDRDSATIAGLFDEENEAVKVMIASVIHTALKLHKPIGICGQAPSDRPGFAAWLVEQGIDSVSLNSDSVIKARRVIADAEKKKPIQKQISDKLTAAVS